MMEHNSAAAVGNQDTPKTKQPHWWAFWCWAIGGVFLNWSSAFNRFAAKSPIYSEAVLLRMALTVTLCALISLIVVSIVRKLSLRDAGPLFFLLSALTSIFAYARI
jgi:hypothetical protein